MTACCFSRADASCWRAIRASCPRSYGSPTLEDLFIRLAREPLTTAAGGERMKLRPVAGVALRQFYLLRGSPIRILPMFAWVAVDIVLWGFITRYLGTLGMGGVNFVPQLLGAVLFWDFFTRIMQGVTTAFLEDVWSRNFLNFFATPLLDLRVRRGLVDHQHLHEPARPRS